MTNRSIDVYAAYQELSVLINNASVTYPEFNLQKNFKSRLFYTDSVAVLAQLKALQTLVLDTINIRIARALDRNVKKELPWLLASNVIDSIKTHQPSQHIAALRVIDSLITAGVNRTAFLFQYRKEKLDTSLKQIQFQILLFLIAASLLLVYVSINLARQYRKRMKKEAILEAQEKKFRALVENSQDLIVMVDAGLQSLYRSPSAARITGFSDAERKPHANVDQVHPDDRERIKGYLDEMRAQPGLVIPASYRVLHKNGHYIWLEGTFTSLLHDPAVGAIVVNMRDVSRRVADEEALKRQEKRFHDSLEYMMEGVQIIGFDWRYIYVNDALTRYSNYPRADMVGKTVMELYPGVEQSALYRALSDCMELRQSRQLESEFVFPDGTRRYFDLRIQPVPEGIYILSIDISERKKGEEEVAVLNRLYAFISAINQSIVHITNRQELLGKACDIATRIGGFQLAWIEMIDNAGGRKIAGISGDAEGV